MDDPLFPEYDVYHRWLSLRPSLGQSRKGPVGHIGEMGRVCNGTSLAVLLGSIKLCETSRRSCVGAAPVESSVRFDMIQSRPMKLSSYKKHKTDRPPRATDGATSRIGGTAE